MQFSVCLPTSCQAQVALSKEMLQRMMAGKQLVIAAVNMQKKTLGFPVPLLGFRKAWEGAPVDTMKYQAARRQMLDFARKTAEKQRDARQPGLNFRRAGLCPEFLEPNGSTTVPKRILHASGTIATRLHEVNGCAEVGELEGRVVAGPFRGYLWGTTLAPHERPPCRRKAPRARPPAPRS